MDTTSDGLGENFEGDFADICANKFPLMLMGVPNGGSSMRRPRSEDTHQCEQIFFNLNKYEYKYICWSNIFLNKQITSYDGLEDHFNK